MDEHQKAMRAVYEAEDPEPGARSLDELIAVIQAIKDDRRFGHIGDMQDDLSEVLDHLRAGNLRAGCKALRRFANGSRGNLIPWPEVKRDLQDVLADLKAMIGYGNYESKSIDDRVMEILEKDPTWQRLQAEGRAARMDEHQARMKGIFDVS